MQLSTRLPKLKHEAHRSSQHSELLSPNTECQAKPADCATKPTLRIKDTQWLNLYKAIDLAG